MNRKFETLEDLEAFLLEKGAGGVTEVLVSELKKKDTEIETLKEDKSADRIRIQSLEDAMLEQEGLI